MELSKKTLDLIDDIVDSHWDRENFGDNTELKIRLICNYFKEYESRLYKGAVSLENGDNTMAHIVIGASDNYKLFKDRP